MTGTHRLRGLSLNRALFGSSLMHPNFLLGLMALQFAIVFLNRSIWRDFGFWAIAIVLALYAAAIVTIVVIGQVRKLPPVIDFDAGELRLGSQVTPFAEVDEAAIIHVTLKKRDDLFLWFGGHKRRHGIVALRARKDALGESDLTVLAAMVERSGIQLPAPKVDPYDPKGTFAWLDQRGFVTKEQVLEAVLHTPATGDVKRT